MEIAIRKIERFNVHGVASTADFNTARRETRSLWEARKEILPPFLKNSSVLYGVTKTEEDDKHQYVFGVRIPESPALAAVNGEAGEPLDVVLVPAGEYAIAKAPENTDISETWSLLTEDALPKKGYICDTARNVRFERYDASGHCELWLPAAAGLSPRLTALSEIEGINMQPALKRLAGKQRVLEMTAFSVGSSIPERLSSLEKQLKDGEIDAFRNDIHGLKGSLAQIGAEGLSGYAARLEEAAKEGGIAYCRDNFSQFAKSVENLSNQLNEIF